MRPECFPMFTTAVKVFRQASLIAFRLLSTRLSCLVLGRTKMAACITHRHIYIGRMYNTQTYRTCQTATGAPCLSAGIIYRHCCCVNVMARWRWARAAYKLSQSSHACPCSQTQSGQGDASKLIHCGRSCRHSKCTKTSVMSKVPLALPLPCATSRCACYPRFTSDPPLHVGSAVQAVMPAGPKSCIGRSALLL